MKFRALALATSLLLGAAGVAQAADMMGYPATQPTAGVITSPNTFDWDGFYAGLGFTGALYETGGVSVGSIDGVIGVNATSGPLLFGAEGSVSGWRDSTPTSGWGASAEVRGGYLASDQVLFYLSGGAVWIDTPLTYWTLGGGVEFGFADNMSIDVEYKHWFESTGGTGANAISASLLWHFN